MASRWRYGGTIAFTTASKHMATRFIFTTRDWCWFCVVFSLAFGWSMHVRYSSLETKVPSTPAPPLDYQQLQANYDAAQKQNFRMHRTIRALNYAAQEVLTDDQKTTFAQKTMEQE